MDDQADGSDNPWRQLDAMWPDGEVEAEELEKISRRLPIMAFENVIGNLIRNQGLSVPKVLQATAGNVVYESEDEDNIETGGNSVDNAPAGAGSRARNRKKPPTFLVPLRIDNINATNDGQPRPGPSRLVKNSSAASTRTSSSDSAPTISAQSREPMIVLHRINVGKRGSTPTPANISSSAEQDPTVTHEPDKDGGEPGQTSETPGRQKRKRISRELIGIGVQPGAQKEKLVDGAIEGSDNDEPASKRPTTRLAKMLAMEKLGKSSGHATVQQSPGAEAREKGNKGNATPKVRATRPQAQNTPKSTKDSSLKRKKKTEMRGEGNQTPEVPESSVTSANQHQSTCDSHECEFFGPKDSPGADSDNEDQRSTSGESTENLDLASGEDEELGASVAPETTNTENPESTTTSTSTSTTTADSTEESQGDMSAGCSGPSLLASSGSGSSDLLPSTGSDSTNHPAVEQPSPSKDAGQVTSSQPASILNMVSIKVEPALSQSSEASDDEEDEDDTSEEDEDLNQNQSQRAQENLTSAQKITLKLEPPSDDSFSDEEADKMDEEHTMQQRTVSSMPAEENDRSNDNAADTELHSGDVRGPPLVISLARHTLSDLPIGSRSSNGTSTNDNHSMLNAAPVQEPAVLPTSTPAPTNPVNPQEKVIFFSCTACSEVFPCYNDHLLRKHVLVKHNIEITDDYFQSYKMTAKDVLWCTKCSTNVKLCNMDEHYQLCKPLSSKDTAFEPIQNVIPVDRFIGRHLCGICDEALDSRYLLKNHLQQAHADLVKKVILSPKFRCAKCLKSFATSLDAIQHWVSPCVDNPSRETILEMASGSCYCDFCEKAHSSPIMTSDCFFHKQAWRCALCLEIFNELRSLTSHLQEYHEAHGSKKKPSVQCPFCPQTGCYTATLPHVLNHHFHDSLNEKNPTALLSHSTSRSPSKSNGVSGNQAES